jgi:hypothetical protein
VRPIIGLRKNFDHRNAPHDECIRYQRAVAAPRHGFGAHDSGAFLLAESDEPLQAARKFVGLHIIGVAAKTCVAPARVDRVLARMPQAAERRQRHVVDILLLERAAEIFSVELRIMPRARHGAHIDQTLDAVGIEQCDKPLDRQRRMADRASLDFGGIMGLAWSVRTCIRSA